MRKGESLVTMPKGRSANSISLIHWGYFLSMWSQILSPKTLYCMLTCCKRSWYTLHTHASGDVSMCSQMYHINHAQMVRIVLQVIQRVITHHMCK